MRTPHAVPPDMTPGLATAQVAGDDFGPERPTIRKRADGRGARRCRARSAHSGGPANPVWLAALCAAGCVAEGLSAVERVAWRFDGERAFYTNSWPATMVVSPFNVPVEPGESLAVSWERGETSYSLRPAA